MSFLRQIAKITDHLYLSSFVGVTEHNIFKHNVTCIITVCKEVPKFDLKTIESLKLDLLDKPSEALERFFDTVADKINDVAKKQGVCLVHCVAGVSRSATMCIAYLMKYANMTLRDAHAHVKSRRTFIRPNLGFWKQLVDYERKLFGSNSVKIVPSNIGFIPDIYESEVKSMYWAKTNPGLAGTNYAAATTNNNKNTSGNVILSSCETISAYPPSQPSQQAQFLVKEKTKVGANTRPPHQHQHFNRTMSESATAHAVQVQGTAIKASSLMNKSPSVSDLPSSNKSIYMTTYRSSYSYNNKH